MGYLIQILKNTAREEGAYVVGEYGHSFPVLTHSDAEKIITYLNQYTKIKKIIEEFYNSDCHRGRGNSHDSMAESFERILNIFKE